MKNIEKLGKVDVDHCNPSFRKSLEVFCNVLLSTLSALESVIRQLYPPMFPKIPEALLPVGEKLRFAESAFKKENLPDEFQDITHTLFKATEYTHNALAYFSRQTQDLETTFTHLLRGMRQHCRAQEAIYPLWQGLRPVNRYFLEKPMWQNLESFSHSSSPNSDSGLFIENSEDSLSTTGYVLYVPETYEQSLKLPLVVALHGGSGRAMAFG